MRHRNFVLIILRGEVEYADLKHSALRHLDNACARDPPGREARGCEERTLRERDAAVDVDGAAMGGEGFPLYAVYVPAWGSEDYARSGTLSQVTRRPGDC